MKVVDWKAVAWEMLTLASRPVPAWFDGIVAKHTREVPDGLTTRMRTLLPCSCAHDDHAELRATLLRDATPEACAALDALPGRFVEVEAGLRGATDAAEKRAVEMERALNAEREQRRAVDLKMTDALNLLDEALAVLLGPIVTPPGVRRAPEVARLIASIAEMTGSYP